MKWRRIGMGMLCIGVLACAAMLVLRPIRSEVPGLKGKERTLLRIWVTEAPGGAVSWLKGQLRAFEKQHPGVSTYLRTVDAAELAHPEAVLPDVVLYMPGDVSAPDGLFLPMTGEATAREGGLLREELLRCGRWRGTQYGLPLCWGAWVLAIDGTLEPDRASTPAPTTLLGRPAATDAPSTPEPGYPMEAASKAACALQSPKGAALFTLGRLLEGYPPLPENFAALPSAEVFAAFRSGKCATAMLTTGQVMALTERPFRVLATEEVITDQVWLGSITKGAPKEAALLLAHLTGPEAQNALSAQGLHNVREDLTLYTVGVPARVESAARKALTAINAYTDAQQAEAAAWQFFQGTIPLDEALLPLL